MTAASGIRRRHPKATITVLEQGQYTSYAACGIPYHIGGDIEALEELVVMSAEDFRSKRDIDVRLSSLATAIDPEAGTVIAATPEGEHVVAWDRLLIATGSRPIVPPWEGRDLEGVAVVRNLTDTARLERWLADKAAEQDRTQPTTEEDDS